MRMLGDSRGSGPDGLEGLPLGLHLPPLTLHVAEVAVWQILQQTRAVGNISEFLCCIETSTSCSWGWGWGGGGGVHTDTF